MIDPEVGQRLSDCARDYANATIGALKTGNSVHPPTAIAGCARMAGTILFRSFRLALAGAEPGQAVLSVEADQHSPILLRAAAATLAQLGTRLPEKPPAELVPVAARPARAFLDTQRLLEPLFAPIRVTHGLDERQSAQAAAIATGLLIHHFAKSLPPEAAFGVAAFSFVEGCKTAPDPIAID